MMKILILGSEFPQALSIVRSLGKDFEVYTVSSGRRPRAAYSRYTKKNYLCANPINEPHRYVEDILKLVFSHGIDIVMGTHETNIFPITLYRNEIEKNAVFGHPPNSILYQAFNKRRTLEIAHKLSIPIPHTWFADDSNLHLINDILPYPVIVKPQWTIYWDGKSVKMARKNVKIVFSKEELTETFYRLKEGDYCPIIQELIPGQGYGGIDVLTLINKRAQLKAFFMSKRVKEVNLSGGAAAVFESISPDEKLKKYTLDLLHEMDWQGISMAEFKQDLRDGVPKFMELNGRFWGQLALAPACGIDFPRLYVDDLMDYERKEEFEYVIGKKMRHLSSITNRFLSLFDNETISLDKRKETLDYLRNLFVASSIFKISDPVPSLIDWIGTSASVLSSIKSAMKLKLLRPPLR